MSRSTRANIALLVVHVLFAGADPEASCFSCGAVAADASLPESDEASFLQVGVSHKKSSMRGVQTGLRSVSAMDLGNQPPQNITSAKWSWLYTIDEHGRYCYLCGEPSAHRSDRDYEKRTDCGNQSMWEHPENKDVPLINFQRPASGDQPETNAFCELNYQKMCADSIYNKDFLFQAKSVYLGESESKPCGDECAFDWWYCKHNGWLEPEILALMHDYEGMKAESERQCSTKYAKYGVNTTFTQNDMEDAWYSGQAKGAPSEDEALIIGAWTCAMGSAGCDMAYCAYSYCDYGDDVVRTYGECEGWDPVQGMPMTTRG